MRFLLLFSIILGNSALMAQNDTVFYRKNLDDGEWHTIYREPDTSSSRYDDLAYFDIEFMDKDVYEYEKQALAASGLYSSSHPVADIPRQWVGLFRYNDEWVAYYPCNFLWQYKVIISDSEFIDWTGEGPQVNYLYEASQLDDHTWQFKMKGNYRTDDTITVHLIDKEKGIAIFEENGSAGKVFYPMITGATIRKVPLIVNHCPAVLQDEFEFGNLDYSVFIK